MKLFSFFFFFLMSLISAVASPEQDLQRGDQLSQELLGKVEAHKQQAGPHPFYQGIPPESALNSTELIGKAEVVSRQSPAAQMVKESSQVRPQFKLDSQKDPLLSGAEHITTNALTVIGGAGTHVVQLTQAGKDETFSCEESGDDSEETCTRTLTVRILKTNIQREWQGWFHIGKCSNKERHGHYLPCATLGNAVLTAVRSGGRGWFFRRVPLSPALLTITGAYKACMVELGGRSGWGCECSASLPSLPCTADKIKEVVLLPHPQDAGRPLMSLEHYHMYNSGRDEWWYRPIIKVVYEEEKKEILPDEWASTCSPLEERADQGLCSYTSKVCTQGPETRVIDGVSITKDCWQETYTYNCTHPSQNNCGPLRARGCAQVKSDCKQRIGRACVVYTQTYHCKGHSTTTAQITGGGTASFKLPFCLDGNCRDQTFEANDEMMSSLAQLHLLKELQGKFDGLLFKGSDNRCSKATLSFKDCCGSGKGWGLSLGLAGCSGEEKVLQLKRQKGLCHFVGTYCSKREKLTKICMQKKSTYCCFGSKLLKAFHEQGRPQIGMTWGSPQEPLCRGFTVEELQRIDFSKLDLHEVFEDLMKSYSPGKFENVNQKLKDRLETIKTGISPKARPSSKQREEA